MKKIYLIFLLFLTITSVNAERGCQDVVRVDVGYNFEDDYNGCEENYKNNYDHIVQGYSYVLEDGSLFNDGGWVDGKTSIPIMYRQHTKSIVFCGLRGKTVPPQKTKISSNRLRCLTGYNFSSDVQTNEKLRAAIGYVINQNINNISGFVDTDYEKQVYADIQNTIHKLLYGINSYKELHGEPPAEMYNDAELIYNKYSNETLTIDPLTISLSGDNWVVTTKITYNTGETSLEFFMNGTTLPYSYVSISSRRTISKDLYSKDITITIPKSVITDKSEITLNSIGTTSYNMADAKFCAEDKQPIIESTTSEHITTTTATASATINPIGSIQIIKTNSATGAAISNIGFTLYTDSNCTAVKENEAKTSSSGEVTFSNLNAGTYYYKETTTPSNYVANTNCNAVTVTAGNTTSLSVTNEPYGTIQIKKQNSLGSALINKIVQFGIYNNSNCSNKVYNFTCNTGGDGICSHNLPSGNYWIKETSAPEGYAISDECKALGTVSPNKTNSAVTYTNVTNCENDLRKDTSIKNRLLLYQTYEYKNLLNFNKTEISEACSAYSPSYGRTTSCLSVDQVNSTTEQKFKNTNLSDYNDTISGSNSISYCLTDFEIKRNANFNTGINAGQMIINIEENSPLLTGTLTKICYIHEADYSKYTITKDNYIKYNDYIKSVSVAGITLNKLSTTTSSLKIEDAGEFKKVVGEVKVKYAPNPVYVYTISGEPCDNSYDNCTLVGYGVISKFNDATLAKPSFSFKLTSNKTSVVKNSSSSCYYSVEPEIIIYQADPNGELDLEFRTIDTNNPFTDRNTNTNWCDGNNCSSSNSVVTDVMNNNNSFNQTGDGPKYKMTLTPSDILNIREYNSTQGNYYDNYDIECKIDKKGDKNCVNSFLKKYKELGVIE